MLYVLENRKLRSVTRLHVALTNHIQKSNPFSLLYFAIGYLFMHVHVPGVSSLVLSPPLSHRRLQGGEPER